ncbi:hypothetical protein FQZ97_787300 [compost metagenome]
MDEELRGVRAVGALCDQPDTRIHPAEPRLQVLAKPELHALLGIVTELRGTHQSHERLRLTGRPDGIGSRRIGIGQERSIGGKRLHPGGGCTAVEGLKVLAMEFLIGGGNLVVAVLGHLVEPVDIGRLAERVLHRDLALPFRSGQLPDVRDRTLVEEFGVVGPDIGAGDHGERVVVLRGNLRCEVRRQPALGKALRNELRHRGRRVADDRDIALDIVGPGFANDHLKLCCRLDLGTLGADPILLGKGLGHFDDLAGAVVDRDRRLLARSLDQRVEIERLLRQHWATQCGDGRCQQRASDCPSCPVSLPKLHRLFLPQSVFRFIAVAP